MRRLSAFLTALLLCASAFAYEPAIKNIDIKLELGADGTAAVTEVWDIVAAEGTEWYLVRNNLGDIVISRLSVSDENGASYIVENEWDVDRSLAQKAGRCGLNHTGEGVEICWGLGSYGPHTYTVRYLMSNAVKSLQDADMLHLQLVSPGLSSPPENVRVSISPAPEGTRFWGFGFEGNSSLSGKEVIFQSKGQFSRNSSVIALLRFPKGFFASPSVQERGFEEVLAGALEGAHFEDENGQDDSFFGKILAGFAAVCGFFFFAGVRAAAKRKRQILGCKPSEVQWNRDIPFGGSLEQSNCTLRNLGEISNKGNTYASALILRMIYSGAIVIYKTHGNKLDLAFADPAASKLGGDARGLYDMLKEASGGDEILQDKEFSRWSRRNYKRVNEWVSSSLKSGGDALEKAGLTKTAKYTSAGQAEARKLLGLKKFLSDYTLIKERASRDVGLWQDYLVFGALFGIADKVAKELRDIDPQFFEQTVAGDFNTMNMILWQNALMSNAITGAQARASEAMSRTSGSFGGFGGGTSFGGGGGFSGGGFGGGAR